MIERLPHGWAPIERVAAKFRWPFGAVAETVGAKIRKMM
jgi:hypothetical protein